MSIKVIVHPHVHDDLMLLSEEAYSEAREALKKLKDNPFLGDPLSDRPDLGIHLSGYRKLYIDNAKTRIVYTIDNAGELQVLVIAIGKRDSFAVYYDAYERAKGQRTA